MTRTCSLPLCCLGHMSTGGGGCYPSSSIRSDWLANNHRCRGHLWMQFSLCPSPVPGYLSECRFKTNPDNIYHVSVAKNIIMDAAILTVLSEPADLYVLKRAKKTNESLPQWACFHFTPNGFGKSLFNTAAQSSPPGVGDAQLSKFFL